MPKIARGAPARSSTKVAAPRRKRERAFGRLPAKAPRTTAASTFKAATTTGAKLVDNQQYLGELMRLLGSAKKSIDLVQYNFFSESAGAKSIADKLIALKRDKPDLQVRLFVEGDHGDGAARNLATVAKLKAAGIDVTLDSKNLITHAKAVTVDGTKILAGSHNLTNTSLNKNNEVSLSIDSAALGKAYETYFQQLEDDPSHVHPSTTTAGRVTMITDTAYEAQLLDVIDHARTSLDASMYDLDFSGHDPKAQEVVDALVAAAARGVKVSLMLEQNSDPKVAPEITKNNAAAAKYLQAHGVTVHLDDPSQISHQKFIIRDGAEVLMGSTNWAKSDLDRRHQINWRLRDPALAGQLNGILQGELANLA